jgi:phospholipase C
MNTDVGIQAGRVTTVMKTTLRSLIVAIVFSLILTPEVLAVSLPRPDHVVVVIEENHGYTQIMDKRNRASYIHALVKRGVLFTESYGVIHPSQPNYLALFSGSTHGIINDGCPLTFDSDNLATRLMDRGLSFASFAESLPDVGDVSCRFGAYQRKHNPASNWQGTRLPAEVNRRLADFPQDFSRLPTVSFVIPNQANDMHDGSFATADEWLKSHLDPYVTWAKTHNSLLILTWDEDNNQEDNHVVTLLVGPMVKEGSTSAQRINHYSVLRTILDFYGLPALGESGEAQAIKNIWKKR